MIRKSSCCHVPIACAGPGVNGHLDAIIVVDVRSLTGKLNFWSYALGALPEITYPSPDPIVCDGALASCPTPNPPLTATFFSIPAVSLLQPPYPLSPNCFPAVTLPSISRLLPPLAFMPLLPHSHSPSHTPSAPSPSSSPSSPSLALWNKTVHHPSSILLAPTPPVSETRFTTPQTPQVLLAPRSVCSYYIFPQVRQLYRTRGMPLLS